MRKDQVQEARRTEESSSMCKAQNCKTTQYIWKMKPVCWHLGAYMQSGKEYGWREAWLEFGLFRTISEFGLSFESKRELSVSNGMINFAFHKIHDESNVVKKLERRWAWCGEGERQEHLK